MNHIINEVNNEIIANFNQNLSCYLIFYIVAIAHTDYVH